VRETHYATQIEDLAALGLDWDGVPIHQRDRTERYQEVLDAIVATGLTYPCYCSRREIREAAQAPNRPLAGRGYPGTCRNLSAAERAEREAAGRPPALRVRANQPTVRFVDLVAGPAAFEVDDYVVRRNDGTLAYHLVNVVDDADLGIEVVVRADDLLDSTSRQLHIASLVVDLLGSRTPDYAHVPLVVGPDGRRLAKRHGAVTLADRAALGESPDQVLTFLAASLGLCDPGEPTTPGALLDRFDPERLPTEVFVLEQALDQNTSSDSV
jgi:glutamyl-tRNA synthetase